MDDKEIIEGWQDTGLLHGMVDPIKEMAWMLENTRNYLITSKPGEKHKLVNFMFPIVRRVYSKLLYRDDITVHTMKGPIDIVNGVKVMVQTESLGINISEDYLDPRGSCFGGYLAIDNEVEITQKLSSELTTALEAFINQKRVVDGHDHFYFYTLLQFQIDTNKMIHFSTRASSSE